MKKVLLSVAVMMAMVACNAPAEKKAVEETPKEIVKEVEEIVTDSTMMEEEDMEEMEEHEGHDHAGHDHDSEEMDND